LLLFNATLSFIQESRASGALAALKNRFAPTSLVWRDGEWVRRPAAELVPGDAIRLSLDVLVPADARIVSGSAPVLPDRRYAGLPNSPSLATFATLDDQTCNIGIAARRPTACDERQGGLAVHSASKVPNLPLHCSENRGFTRSRHRHRHRRTSRIWVVE
jgi:hypothetical protein